MKKKAARTGVSTRDILLARTAKERDVAVNIAGRELL
jgi:hypothetical protein